MTTKERIKELAEYVWEGMDMKVVEVFVLETLTDNFEKHPKEFEAAWKDYQEETA